MDGVVEHGAQQAELYNQSHICSLALPYKFKHLVRRGPNLSSVLKHILVVCKTSLTEGRYTWHHSQVLNMPQYAFQCTKGSTATLCPGRRQTNGQSLTHFEPTECSQGPGNLCLPSPVANFPIRNCRNQPVSRSGPLVYFLSACLHNTVDCPLG